MSDTLALLLTAKAAGIEEPPTPGTAGALFLLGLGTAAAEMVDDYRETNEHDQFVEHAGLAVVNVLPTAVKWQVWTDLRLWQQEDEPNLTSLDALVDGALSTVAARIAEWIWDGGV
jgi:hypothetical protein